MRTATKKPSAKPHTRLLDRLRKHLNGGSRIYGGPTPITDQVLEYVIKDEPIRLDLDYRHSHGWTGQELVESVTELERLGFVKRWTDNTNVRAGCVLVGTVNQRGVPEPGEPVTRNGDNPLVDARTTLAMIRSNPATTEKKLAELSAQPLVELQSCLDSLEGNGLIKRKRNGKTVYLYPYKDENCRHNH